MSFEPQLRFFTRARSIIRAKPAVVSGVPRSHHAGWAEPSSISCDTVRANVSQMGFAQARAIALANGMTAAQERRARQCLAKKG
jgi:hypothetical protein